MYSDYALCVKYILKFHYAQCATLEVATEKLSLRNLLL